MPVEITTFRISILPVVASILVDEHAVDELERLALAQDPRAHHRVDLFDGQGGYAEIGSDLNHAFLQSA